MSIYAFVNLKDTDTDIQSVKTLKPFLSPKANGRHHVYILRVPTTYNTYANCKQQYWYIFKTIAIKSSFLTYCHKDSLYCVSFSISPILKYIYFVSMSKERILRASVKLPLDLEVMYHVSCIMYHVSHVSCIMYHVSCIMYHVSCIMYHVSCIMYHVSHVSCIMYHVDIMGKQ